MDPRHKNLILENLTRLVGLVQYHSIKPFLDQLRIFPASHIKRLDERTNPCLDLFLEVQRRGPTAFRRLLAALKLSGHDEALNVLSSGGDLYRSGGDLYHSGGDPYRNEGDLYRSGGNLYLDNSVFLDKPPLNIPAFTQNIDLTDSPLQPNQISVLQATVFHEEDEMTYKMTSSPRGFALIVDNEDYDTLPARRGSHVDSQCLTQLFQQLGFWVILKRNLGRASLDYELTCFATDNFHVNVDMAVVCILSHGENGTIVCRNGEKVDIETILQKFNNQAAPSLRGKPKYFLIQSCRGLHVDTGIETDGPPANPAGENLLDIQGVPLNHFFPPLEVVLSRNPSYEDIFVSYATIPGFVAYRNNVKGSWFVQSFCKVFMEYAHEEDLLTLLHRVSQELKTYCTVKGEKQMCETLLRGVYKKIFFNPGLADRNRVLSDQVLDLRLVSAQPSALTRQASRAPRTQAGSNRPEKMESESFEQVWNLAL